MKTILLTGALMAGLGFSAWAFSLEGPVGNGGDAWQTGDNGYGGLGAPKNIGEEFRRNTPVMYYAFDAQFLGYFGTNGMAAVSQSFAVLNSLTNVSSYSRGLSEFPLETRHVNYQAQALGLFDLKSFTLGIMVEQLGLTDPVAYTWAMHDHFHVGTVPCPVGMEYLVVQRNFDIISSPLNQLQYSPYVNDTLYSYLVSEGCPPSVAVPYPVDPLADVYSPVASGVIGYGDYYTGLTRDDVAGLRYLLQTNNINQESPSPDSQMFVTITNTLQAQFPNGAGTNSVGNTAGAFYYYDGTYGYGDLRGLLAASVTNGPAALQAMYPGLVISSYTNYFVVASNLQVISYFAPAGAGYPYGSVVLKTQTIVQKYLQERFGYVFANLFPNHTYPKSYSYVKTYNVGPLAGAPAGSPSVTNVSTKTIIDTNTPSGDFFVLPLFQTNVCPFSILYVGLTNVTATTNLITSAGTNVVTATNTSVYSYYQDVVTYFTNYTFVINPVTCTVATNSTGWYQGIENIKFVNANYDSLIGQFFQPVTNNYTMDSVVNSQLHRQYFQRLVTQPDFIFDAQDMTAGPNAPPVNIVFGRNLNYDTANVLPGLAGPGTLVSPTTITFNKAGPVYYNAYADVMDGTPFFSGLLPGSDVADLFYSVYFVWASYDGTTNAPVVYPDGASLDDLENQILIQVSPGGGLNGYAGSPYGTNFTATGGAFTSPYLWAASGLPAGLNLLSDGTLTGTPTQAGTNYFTLVMTDAVGRSVQWKYQFIIQMTISPSPASVLINNSGAVGSAYSTTFTATGGTPPYTWSTATNSLPPGLTLSSGGVLTGTPTQVGTYNFNLMVTDALSNTAQQAYSVIISN